MYQKIRHRRHKVCLFLTLECINRIMADLKEAVQSGGKNGVFVFPDEDDVTHIEALIIGPDDTPYAGGMFHFDMRFPHNYPWDPPKVFIMTTDAGRCRFNPNLYSNGKVCLSILGTWSGPGWTSVQTILSTLLSIQSLMNPAPYHNEPGFEQEHGPGEVENYNACIRHETIRVAVVGMMKNPTCGEKFKEEMEELFLARYDQYQALCDKHLDSDQKPMTDPFGESRGNFQYKALKNELNALKAKLSKAKGIEVDATPAVADSGLPLSLRSDPRAWRDRITQVFAGDTL